MRYIDYYSLTDDYKLLLIDRIYEEGGLIGMQLNPKSSFLVDIRRRCKTLEDVVKKMGSSYTVFGVIKEAPLPRKVRLIIRKPYDPNYNK